MLPKIPRALAAVRSFAAGAAVQEPGLHKPEAEAQWERLPAQRDSIPTRRLR